jgi:hypothetical protein
MLLRQCGTISVALLLTLFSFFSSVQADDTVPTYGADIAPLMQKACISCHRPGASGPFPLLTYSDVRRRVSQIVQVTQSGYMPPWKTITPGFCGERGLSDTEKSQIKQWADKGAPEGDATVRTATPAAPTVWSLGLPDKVVTMPRPFALPANTLEVTRCFVLPNVTTKDVLLRAIAFHPSNPRIVRYVALYLDTRGEGRRQESVSGAVGYLGFASGIFPPPAGSLIDWSPGATVLPLPTGYALRLPKGADLILQVRFQPTGKPETEQMKVGLYFEKGSKTLEPVTLRIGKAELYLPRESTGEMSDTFTLPVAAHLFEIVPNAHTVAQQVTITATFPDGKTTTLLNAPDWDVNWKQPYRYQTPLLLPAMTRLTLNMTFNNTDENPRSPWKPTHRIVPGLEFMEEMSSVWLRLLPGNAADRARLQAALPRANHQPTMAVEEREPEGKAAPPPRPGPPTGTPGKNLKIR